MGPIGYPETSVINYSYSLRNNSEERSSHLFRGGSLKSLIVKCCIVSTNLYGAESWALQKVDQKIPGNFRNVVLEKDGEDQL